MFRYKAIGQNPIIALVLRSGKHMEKSLKQNKRVMAKNRPLHVENVRSGKWQYWYLYNRIQQHFILNL